MSFRRYPEKQYFPCTPFTEKQVDPIECENGMVKGVVKEIDLNHYQFPDGIREKYDLETAIESGENLEAVSSTLIENDLAPIVEQETQNEPQTKGE